MTRKLLAALAGLMLCGSAFPADTCATLEACLARYPAAGSSDPGVGQDEQRLAEAVQKYGAQAIPGLIELLASDSPNARELAGYTLRDIEGLKPEHLPALIRARKAGDGWIPPAIARVGTPEAVAFLVEDLRRDPEMHTQVTWALELLGERAALPLAELFACVEDCNVQLFSTVGRVFGEMKDNALAAVPRLLQIAGDRKFNQLARQYAVQTIGDVGDSAARYVPQLNELKKADASLAHVVDATLSDVGSADAVPALVQALPADPERILSEISRLGKNGSAAGPKVLGYLDHGDWDVRVAAAVTLGYIDYQPAQQALVTVLANQDDWKLVFAAVLSLARLESAGSLDALKGVRDSYWYPPVRTLADNAVAHIESGAELDEPDWWRFGSIRDSPPSCSTVRERAVKVPKSQKVHPRSGAGDFRLLAYDATIVSYDAAEGTEPDKNGVIVVNESNIVRHEKQVRTIPDVGLRVSGGWLVGTDRGEWGGELVHVSGRGEANVLYGENIEDIHQLGSRLVATSGLSHMMMNRGILLRIELNDSGRYVAALWKRLPAAPGNSLLIEGDQLLIHTEGGGSVIVDAHGNLRMAQCLTTRSEQ